MTVTIYEVGGKIRDEFLGLKNNDLDYSVEAGSYQEMKDWIISKGGQIFLETPEYFTIRAKLPILGAADYVLCRREGAYRDGRHPDNVEIGTIYDDLARRDFTMNDIAKNVITEEIIDPSNGRQDIQDRIINCVGGVGRSFMDDGLRMFRAMRFSVTKRFIMASDIEDALNQWEFINLIEKQEENRIREEMLKMFKFDTWASIKMMRNFPTFWNRVFEVFPNLWLKPTVEEK